MNMSMPLMKSPRVSIFFRFPLIFNTNHTSSMQHMAPSPNIDSPQQMTGLALLSGAAVVVRLAMSCGCCVTSSCCPFSRVIHISLLLLMFSAPNSNKTNGNANATKRATKTTRTTRTTKKEQRAYPYTYPTGYEYRRPDRNGASLYGDQRTQR